MVGGKLEELLQPDQGLRVLVQDGEHPPPVGKDQVPVGKRYGGRVGAEIDGVSLQLLGHHIPAGGDVGDLEVVTNGLDVMGDAGGLGANNCGNAKTK